MNKLRYILLIIGVIFFIDNLTYLNYSNLGWSVNSDTYIRMITSLCIIISMALSIRASDS